LAEMRYFPPSAFRHILNDADAALFQWEGCF
jgi:hypothetical protein